MVWVFTTAPTEADEAAPEPFDTMIEQATGGGTRSDLFDIIEKTEAERARQKAERAARESETRAILVDVREKIFEIRLNIAAIEGIKSGKPDCGAHQQQDAKLSAQTEDLEKLAKSAGKHCDAAGPDNPVIVELCRGRLTEIAAERNAIEREHSSAANLCRSDAKTGSAAR